MSPQDLGVKKIIKKEIGRSSKLSLYDDVMAMGIMSTVNNVLNILGKFPSFSYWSLVFP